MTLQPLGELFHVEYGSKLDMNKMTPTDPQTGIAFVGRVGGLNGKSGVSGYVEALPDLTPYPAGLITVALGGSRLLSSYVQQRPFYTAQNVAVLRPKRGTMSLNERLFYVMCIRRNAFRYSAFGREANRTLATIEVPNELPDWVESSKIPTHAGLRAATDKPITLTDPDDWHDFPLDQLFLLKKGKRVTKANRLPGKTRFISATDSNNGISDWNDLDPIFPENSITVPYDGSIGYAFFQPEPYFALDSVNALIPRQSISVWQGLFLVTAIRFEKWRFSYGYKWNLARMKKTTIRLPATPTGDPDWDYMERFMKGLPFSAALAGEVGG